jgi:hypothetical protein
VLEATANHSRTIPAKKSNVSQTDEKSHPFWGGGRFRCRIRSGSAIDACGEMKLMAQKTIGVD